MLQVFKNLKYIDLSDSKYLAETPDFSRVTNLKMLSFEGCTQLRKIHSSLGDLDKLIGLSFKNCINLEHFPGLDQLVSLEALNLSGCSKLEKFPVISQPMHCLSKLCFDGTAITELPSSIAYATKLVVLDLQNCEKLLSLPSSICKLAHLETLSLSGCSRLGKPQVNSDNLDALPRILDRLSHLRELQLQDCRSLRALPPLPSSMELINASDNCTSLEYISPQSVFLCFGGSIFGNCFQLTKYQSKMGPHLWRMATHFDQDRWKSAYDQVSPLLVSCHHDFHLQKCYLKHNFFFYITQPMKKCLKRIKFVVQNIYIYIYMYIYNDIILINFLVYTFNILIMNIISKKSPLHTIDFFMHVITIADDSSDMLS